MILSPQQPKILSFQPFLSSNKHISLDNASFSFSLLLKTGERGRGGGIIFYSSPLIHNHVSLIPFSFCQESWTLFMDRARVDIQLRASTIKEEAAQKRERLSA